MLAANNFTTAYARALLAATPRDRLNSAKARQIRGSAPSRWGGRSERWPICNAI